MQAPAHPIITIITIAIVVLIDLITIITRFTIATALLRRVRAQQPKAEQDESWKAMACLPHTALHILLCLTKPWLQGATL